MSDSTGPVRRRRIAGEAAPAAPAPAPKAPTRRPRAAKKAVPAAKKASPLTKKPAPVAKVPAVATPAARKTPVTKPVVAPTVSRPSADGDDATSPRARGSRPSRRDLAWLVPATLLALVSMAAGIYLVVNPPGGSDDVEAADRQASAAAARSAETIFSYRYDKLDDHLKASKELMTPTFAKEFDKIAPALTELAPQRKIVVEAAAREAAALPCGDDCSATKVDVLVFVDQARLVGDAAQPTVFANRIKVSMEKDSDGWRVANIRAL
ncbi:MAG: hypothetical protein ABWY58_14955 [Aeromicrobium sp.]